VRHLLVMSETAKTGSVTESLVLGGGCFWCTEAAYQMLPGVISVVSGYTAGEQANPTYEAVCGGRTGHAEVVKITFDPAQVSRDRILELFWKIHDPTTLNRQGADAGTQYRSIILYVNEVQKAAAESSRDAANPGWGNAIVTQIESLGDFYAAEAYHQNYYARNPAGGYCQAVIRPKLEKFSAAL
jgi:peptide-methionine (S)-S-oxide reductase